MYIVVLLSLVSSLTIEINGQDYTDDTYDYILDQYGQDITTINSIIVKEGTFTPVSFKKYLTLRKIVIPYDSFAGKILISWFKQLASLVYVDIEGCTSIEEQSFDGCTGLEEVSFPYCTQIGNYAFRGCSSLSSVYLPNVNQIYAQVFKNSGISEISLDSLTKIKANFDECNTFQSCTNLKYVSIASLPKITGYMFRDCRNLHTVYAPSCTEIVQKGFTNCNKLSSLTIGLPEVEFSNIPNPYALTKIDFPYATSIDSTSFAKLTDLVSCKLGSIIDIEDNLFQDFKYLTELELPSVIQLGKDVFQNCIKLTTLSLRSLELVDSTSPNLFSGCKLLTSIYLPDAPPQTFHKDTFKGLRCKIIIPIEASSTYDDDESIEGDKKGDGYWCGIPLNTQKISVKINDDENTYSGDQLSDCITQSGVSESLIKSLTIENGRLNLEQLIPEINKLPSLEDLKITNLATITSALTNGIFSGLTLSTFIIDIEIDKIPAECFKNCLNLRTAYINKCNTAESRCFTGCINLEEVVLNVEELIGDYHFEGCTSLQTVSLRKLLTVDSSSEHIFTDCPLSSIYLPPSQPPSTFNRNTFTGKDVLIKGLTNNELKKYDEDTQVSGDVANDNKWCGISLSNSYIEVSLNDEDFIKAESISDAISKSNNVITVTKINIKSGMVKKSHFNEISTQSSLSTLIIQETATLESYILDDGLFKDMKSLTLVSIMKNVSLSSECFSLCSSLTSVEFGSANLLGEKCFYGCTSLSNLVIPNCYILQGDNVFGNCQKLSSIDLSSLKNVDEKATSIFSGCTYLKKLYLPSKEPNKFNKNTFVGLTDIELILPYPDDYISYDDDSHVEGDEAEDNTWCGIKFKSEYASFIYHFKINDQYFKRRSLTNIGIKKSALKSETELIEIKSLELVEGYFKAYDVKALTYDCSTLEKFIAQPQTLKEILPDTFYGCSSLNEITILSDAQIGLNSLQGLSSLTNLTLSLADSISYNEFENDKNLRYVSLPSLKNVPSYLFSGFDKLEKIDLFAATRLESGCFMNCVSLKEIDLTSVKILYGDSHFNGCSNLAQIDLSSLESVDKNSSDIFLNCKQLKTLKLPNEPPNMFNEKIFENAGTIPTISLINETGWSNYVKQSVLDPDTDHYIWYGIDTNRKKEELVVTEKGKKSGHSNGAMAAAIIVSILGAAAISAVVTYFVLKKTKKQIENSP